MLKSTIPHPEFGLSSSHHDEIMGSCEGAIEAAASADCGIATAMRRRKRSASVFDMVSRREWGKVMGGR